MWCSDAEASVPSFPFVGVEVPSLPCGAGPVGIDPLVGAAAFGMDSLWGALASRFPSGRASRSAAYAADMQTGSASARKVVAVRRIRRSRKYI